MLEQKGQAEKIIHIGHIGQRQLEEIELPLQVGQTEHIEQLDKTEQLEQH